MSLFYLKKSLYHYQIKQFVAYLRLKAEKRVFANNLMAKKVQVCPEKHRDYMYCLL